MTGGHRALLEQRLAALEPYPAGRFSGKGIVIAAGGPDLFTNAYVLIHLLRAVHGCALPIEVWHFGAAEMSPRMKRLLRAFAVDTIDAERVLAAQPAAIRSGWPLKPYALMWSRFEQALLLDADQVPLRDPAGLFDWDAVRATGALLWPDVNDILAANPAWAACGLPPRAMPAIESGQLLIDKSRHWAALQTALHLNEHADHYYEFLYGDKDTWLLALLLTGEPYALVPHRPFADVPFCLHQRDMEGEPLFQHRTGAKWRYAGAQIELPNAALRDECRHALATLRAQWNGLVFNPPPRGAQARETEARLAAIGHFELASPGERTASLELLSDGDIGAGRARDRMNWHCDDSDGDVALVISDAFAPTWRFRPAAGDRWLAQSPATQAWLAPAAARDRIEQPARPAWPTSGSYTADPEIEL